MTAFWPDVSHYDIAKRGGAPIDWRAATLDPPSTGMASVCCVRVSYGYPGGFNPPSPHGVATLLDAERAGLQARGGYHNLVTGNTGAINAQVDYLRAQLDAGHATWAMLDIERYDEMITQGVVPTMDDVNRFHDRWYALEGRTLAFYLARWVWQRLGSPDLRGLRGPLINADYRGGTGPAGVVYQRGGGDTSDRWAPYGARVPDGLQFSDTVAIPGITTAGDCNAYRRGSAADLVRYLNGQPSRGEMVMPVFYQIKETLGVGVSDGPTRYGFATVDEFNLALTVWGKPPVVQVPQAQVGAFGALISEDGAGGHVSVTPEQMAQITSAVEHSLSAGLGRALHAAGDAAVGA